MARVKREDLEPYDVAIENLERLVAELSRTVVTLTARVRQLETQQQPKVPGPQLPQLPPDIGPLRAFSENWWV